MKLKDILSISGKGGLFKFVSQAKNGIIVESFADGKRIAVPTNAKVSALEDIAIFTETEEVPLGDIFSKIFEKEDGKETINHKSTADELKAFLESILPDYDRERVYVSDMKKLVQWYNQLIGLNLLKPEEDKDDKKETSEKGSMEKKPASKTRINKPMQNTASRKPSSSAMSKSAATRSTKSK